MRRSERELRKKHALEIKQQPKSLKVKPIHSGNVFHFAIVHHPIMLFPRMYQCFCFVANIAKGDDGAQAVPRDMQGPDEAVQGAEGADPAEHAQGGPEDCDQEAEGGAAAQARATRRPVRTEHRRDAAEAVHPAGREPGGSYPNTIPVYVLALNLLQNIFRTPCNF